ncbi:MAG: hypothetical protein WBD99_10765 [Thermodesulfobacteriota bacterium]
MNERSSFSRNDGSTASSENVINLLNQMGINDPRLQMIAEFMRRQSPPQAENAPTEERQAKIKRIVARYEQLKHENMILMERNDILASALGACPDCWGEDEGCEMCEGKGVPGAYIPDRDAFVQYVLPSVRTLRVFKRKDRSISTDSAMETKANSASQHNNISQNKEV